MDQATIIVSSLSLQEEEAAALSREASGTGPTGNVDPGNRQQRSERANALVSAFG
jgi:hypothetical protein